MKADTDEDTTRSIEKGKKESKKHKKSKKKKRKRSNNEDKGSSNENHNYESMIETQMKDGDQVNDEAKDQAIKDTIKEKDEEKNENENEEDKNKSIKKDEMKDSKLNLTIEKEEVEKEEEKEEATSEAITSKRKRKRKRKKKANANPDLTEIVSFDSNATASEIIEARKQLSKLEVYIEGLPFECTEEEVKDFFIHGGCSDIHEIRLPRWQDSGRLRGYGHVTFTSLESRNKAIQSLSGEYLKKRYITIVPSRQPNATPIDPNHNSTKLPPKGCCTIFVKNLPYDISEQDMEQTFRKFGKLANDSGGSVRLALNSTTRKPKGFGYVQFKNPEGAIAAVQKANDISGKGGIVLKGRILFVDYEERGMKMSFRTTEGKLWSKEHGTSDNKRFKRGPTLH